LKDNLKNKEKEIEELKSKMELLERTVEIQNEQLISKGMSELEVLTPKGSIDSLSLKTESLC
jgi:predicted nuclease with TOPRIM domain